MTDDINDRPDEGRPTGRMSDDELRYITDREIDLAYSWSFGKIASERSRAMQYYLGLPEGDLAPPAIEGRSSVVSTDVLDTVEWMLPPLIEIFTAGDDVVAFTARKKQDEAGAEQTTDVVNYVFYQQNPGWQVLYTWFKDALLQKNGIVKYWWDATPETVREEYRALTDAQFTLLLQDETVEPVEHTAYPDPQAIQMMAAQTGLPADAMAAHAPQVHDVAVVRTTASGKVCIENVPPEEFLISRSAKRIGDGFCGHRVERTISYLRQQGYENVDEITSDELANPLLNQEAIVRRELEDAPYSYDNEDGNGDETMRRVWLTECYMQVDYDGDGVAEWRKIVRAGNAILDNAACDGPPFASLCPIPLPHLFHGLSEADLAMPIQKLKTAIWRGLLDNMHLQINGRTWAVNGQVNLDDLLTNRPGGVVRVNSPNMIGPLQQGMTDSASAYQMLQFAEEAKENRTGITKYSQGSDADTLNKTARGLENITNRSDQRIKLIARIFAETGVKDLFRGIQKLLGQYQDRNMTVRLRGQWVDVDPRAWKNAYDMTVNVGLGTGDKAQTVQHLMTLAQAQAQGLQIGIATPDNLYHTGVKLAQALGYKQPDEFFTDPSKQPPQQPKPDPDMAKVQAQMQLGHAKMQADMQTKQAEIAANHDAKMAEIQANVQAAQLEQAFQAQQAQHQNELEAQRSLQQAQLQAHIAAMQQQHEAAMAQQAAMLEQWRVNLEQSTKVLVAEIAAQNKLDAQGMAAEAAAARDINQSLDAHE